MTGQGAASLQEMLDERRHLLETAGWMFGAAAADQIVLETYRRWYALDDGERARIAVPRAWLTRVAGGICLDLLARSSSSDLGPVPGPGPRPQAPRSPAPRPRTPAGRPAEDPVEAWLRRHPQQDDTDPALLARHDHVVRRFAAACGTGDTETLRRLLADDAIVVGDGGGKVRAVPHPIHGAAAVAGFVTTLLNGEPRMTVTVESVNGRTGLVPRRAGRAAAVISLSVAGAEVTAVWIVLNPDKLRRWNRS
ncbi:nuclear transport factor 2 family protein [Spirillospora sp. NPDC047279]|uniref:nuclear transport factor 2 family protein n=1 Tax=Spirillospora sp. NPDC047279 TaxID=3155478 RepID=UPI00340F601C